MIESEMKIHVSEICRNIDMTADAIRANGLSFSDQMTIDNAIEFVRKRTVATGRWTKEKADKAILYMAELESVKSESKNIDILKRTSNSPEAGNSSGHNVAPAVSQKKEKPKNPIDWIRVVALFFAGGIVVGHGALIWYDCALLWYAPGFIAGLVVFLMIVFGMLVMATKGMKEVAETMTWVVWTLEGAAIFVHVPSFTANASQAYARGLGELHTWLLSAIICICSIAATYAYKETILLTEKPKK